MKKFTIAVLSGLAVWGFAGGRNMTESTARASTGAGIPPIDASVPDRTEKAAFALG